MLQNILGVSCLCSGTNYMCTLGITSPELLPHPYHKKKSQRNGQLSSQFCRWLPFAGAFSCTPLSSSFCRKCYLTARKMKTCRHNQTSFISYSASLRGLRWRYSLHLARAPPKESQQLSKQRQKHWLDVEFGFNFKQPKVLSFQNTGFLVRSYL